MNAEHGPWIHRLVSVLRERWDDTNGEPRWLLTYAELGQLAEHFPGTTVQIESGMFDTDGEIHLRLKLMPPDTLPDVAPDAIDDASCITTATPTPGISTP